MSDFYNPLLDPSRDLSPAAVSRALDQYAYELEDAKKRIAAIKKRKKEYTEMFDDEIKAQETRAQEAILVLDMLQHDYDANMTETIIDIPDDMEMETEDKAKTPKNDAPGHKVYELLPLGDDRTIIFTDVSDEDEYYNRLYGMPF